MSLLEISLDAGLASN